MRTVALCGFSEKSWGPAFDLPEDIELWTCNHAYRLGFPRIDRLFEMHHVDLLKDKHYYERKMQREHIKYLRSASHPICMLDHYDEFPASERFPIEDAVALDPEADFCSTFDYMMAYAILQGDIEKVLLYGYDMDSESEWSYQRPSAKEWMKHARLVGIKIGGEGGLLEKRKLYGYEESEMVSRQTIEMHRKQYMKQLKDNEIKMHFFEGRMDQLIAGGNGNVDEKTKEHYAAQIRQLAKMVWQAEAGVVVCQNFIDECDLKEVEPIIVSRVAV